MFLLILTCISYKIKSWISDYARTAAAVQLQPNAQTRRRGAPHVGAGALAGVGAQLLLAIAAMLRRAVGALRKGGAVATVADADGVFGADARVDRLAETRPRVDAILEEARLPREAREAARLARR